MTLQLENVTLSYPDGDRLLTAIDQADLSVDSGEFAAIVGPSGSGKSSLLAIAGTLIRPQAGRVKIGNIDVTDLNQAARTRVRSEHVGFVFQGVNLLTGLTAVDQLLAAIHLAGQRPTTRRNEAEGLLAALGLNTKLHRRPNQLSGGERQRVGIARALINNPTLLLVDEPTSALDHERGDQIVRLLAGLTHTRGVATVMVTHDQSHLHHVDTIHRMYDGRLEPASTAAAETG